jgi:ankyrin repeat protein
VWAVAHDRLPVIRTLIANGAEVDARKEGGVTPIMLGARNGNEAIVKLLLSGGALWTGVTMKA